MIKMEGNTQVKGTKGLNVDFAKKNIQRANSTQEALNIICHFGLQGSAEKDR